MSDDRQDPPADDATRPLPRPPDDATGRLPAADRTAPLPADRPPAGGTSPVDATARQEPVDATRPLPPAGGSPPPGATDAPVWSGRAGVPAARAGDPGEPAEWYAEEQRGRRWWTPILLGVLGLVLLGLVGAGIWLALRAVDTSSDGTPTPPPTAVPTTGAAPTTAPPSTPPTTGPPTTPPTTAPTTEPAGIPVPPLVGLSQETAEALLGRLGLSSRVQTRESDRPPGTVLSTDPGAGQTVSPGDEVTLVVAAEPSVSPSGTATPTGTPTG
ncbi:PASTA domain-containing protein [Micromonospora sp. WMMD723]|uniref:PASTA domain-containing protein n=1 Tax=Micromonospora sp. WMMD723 TaxID=3403465 RepID=UPI003CF4A0A0